MYDEFSAFSRLVGAPIRVQGLLEGAALAAGCGLLAFVDGEDDALSRGESGNRYPVPAIEVIRGMASTQPPVDSLLLAILTAHTEHTGVDRAQSLVSAIGEYARYLQHSGLYDVAREVFDCAERIVVRNRLESHTPNVATRLFLDAAVLASLRGAWDDERHLLGAARELTLPRTETDPLRLSYVATLANSMVLRGNLRDAEQTFSSLYETALRASERDIACLCLKGRGAARHRMGHVIDALQDFYVAYRSGPDARMCETLLLDMSVCLASLGHYTAAHRVLVSIRERSHYAINRSYAGVNLLKVALARKDCDGFERAWEAFQREVPICELSLQANLYRAESVELFRRKDDAQVAYQYVATQAEAAGMYRIADEAHRAAFRLAAPIGTPEVAYQQPTQFAEPTIGPDIGPIVTDVLAHCDLPSTVH